MIEQAAADPDRRFRAYAVDTLAGWVSGAAVGALLVLADLASVPGGLAVGVAVTLVAGLLAGAVEGLTTSSPGKRVAGLRLMDAASGGPIGAGRGLLRGLLVWLAGAPTLGLGAAMLAWGAASDPEGRGWHDRRTAARVVARPRPVTAPAASEQPLEAAMINLTAMRLRSVPAPASAAADVPATASSIAGPPEGRSAPQPSAEPGTRPPGSADAVHTRASRRAVGHDWRVTFDTGETFVVEGLGLLGRGPAARPGEPVAHTVPLRSEDMSLSKTHAQFHLAGDGALVVMDRGSTNGSVLLRRGLSRELRPGRPTTLLDGDRVRFGDREMRVTREV